MNDISNNGSNSCPVIKEAGDVVIDNIEWIGPADIRDISCRLYNDYP